jgi:hypothetical protein
MKVIGLSFTKISASKVHAFQMGKAINTDIEFLDIDKASLSLLKDDSEALRVSFRFSVNYLETDDKKSKKNAEISLEGDIIVSGTKDESKDVQKAWKKKEIPASFKVPLFNLILRKCSPRALQLEEELNLPSHIPIPQIHPGRPQQSSQTPPAQEEKEDKK